MRYDLRAVIDTQDRDPEQYNTVQPTGPEILGEFTSALNRWRENSGDVYFDLIRADVWEGSGGIDMPKPDTTELRRLVALTKKLALGDSNDAEIEGLQDAVTEACSLLGIDEDELAGDQS